MQGPPAAPVRSGRSHYSITKYSKSNISTTNRTCPSVSQLVADSR